MAQKLSEMLGRPVGFVDDCIGEKVGAAANQLAPGGILLLENVRCYHEEEANDPAFAEMLARVAKPGSRSSSRITPAPRSRR